MSDADNALRSFLRLVDDDEAETEMYELRVALGELIEPMNGDEIRVLTWVAERLDIGRARYGPMDIAVDTRDDVAEMIEEVADGLVYSAKASLRLRKPSLAVDMGVDMGGDTA